MYLPSINELNKNALSLKVVDENDERVRRTVMKGNNGVNAGQPGVMGYSPSISGYKNAQQNRFSVNPQDNTDAISANNDKQGIESLGKYNR
jgi:hypothetical protein